jgi:hypothetical protein
VNIRNLVRVGLVTVALGCLATGQEGMPRPQKEPQEGQEDVKLPNGKSQREEILKDEHQKSLRDIKEILEQAGQLQAALEKDNYMVLSVSSLKKAERIEKLARQIRTRLQR